MVDTMGGGGTNKGESYDVLGVLGCVNVELGV